MNSTASLVFKDHEILKTLTNMEKQTQIIQRKQEHLSRYLRHLMQMEILMTSQVQGTEMLGQGKLSTALVSSDELSEALHKLARNVQKKYPAYKLVYRNINHYYSFQKVVFTLHEVHIYIHLNVPFANNDVLYDMYSVHHHDD